MLILAAYIPGSMSTSSEVIEQTREKVIERIAEGIQSVTVDGTTVTAMSPRTQLEALRDEERRQQSQSGVSPLRLTRVWSKGI